MDKFERVTNGFNFVYEKELAANETVIVDMPSVSPNKRGVNDIGWQTDGDITLYGTLSKDPESDTALWQEIKESDEINKTVSAIKIVNSGAACKVAIRVIMC
ncbi:MAG: hypothetical protein IJC06_01935 [Clostridia bacterium]|nr:hypothetical protein [Clostridia bacterium]